MWFILLFSWALSYATEWSSTCELYILYLLSDTTKTLLDSYPRILLSGRQYLTLPPVMAPEAPQKKPWESKFQEVRNVESCCNKWSLQYFSRGRLRPEILQQQDQFMVSKAVPDGYLKALWFTQYHWALAPETSYRSTGLQSVRLLQSPALYPRSTASSPAMLSPLAFIWITRHWQPVNILWHLAEQRYTARCRSSFDDSSWPGHRLRYADECSLHSRSVP